MERIPATTTPQRSPVAHHANLMAIPTMPRTQSPLPRRRLGAGLTALLASLMLVATMGMGTVSAAPAAQTVERAHSAFVGSAMATTAQSFARVPAAAPQLAYVLSVRFTGASAVDYSYGHVCVQTAPYAALTIAVRYCSGHVATSRSLQGTQYANGSGYKSWYWTPMTKCRGWATATVTSLWHGQRVVRSTSFYVH